MKFLLFMTSSPILMLVQFLASSWFLFDFFLARDSLTVSGLWRTNKTTEFTANPEIQVLVSEIRKRHCPKEYFEEPHFEKVILVVIDALGSHFLPILNGDTNLKSNQLAMPFLEGLIVQHEAVAVVGKAATPTVTMPRIKALLSGTIPSFVDILYNLASDVSKFSDDNILRIAKTHNKSIVFYGDDTWLSLFNRSIFLRSEETLSFYASDYTTVDTNVTRRAIPETELDPIDWDYLILHYLGLDHIGHVFGSNVAPLIKDKLLEMDNVINRIYENMRKKKHRTLMIICGDHGMSKEGNHGGSSDLEARTLMAFIPINQQMRMQQKSSYYPEVIQQIDMAVTLSLLTGMPIPSASRGVGIHELLKKFWDAKKLSCASMENVLQLINISDPMFVNSTSMRDELVTALEAHYKSTSSSFGKTNLNYFKLARKFQDHLLETIAKSSNLVLLITIVSLVAFVTLLDLKRVALRLLLPTIPRYERFISLVIFVTPIIMLGSTNFIENEHIFWPIFSVLALAIVLLSAYRVEKSSLRGLEVHRVGLLIVTLYINSCWNNFVILHNSSIFPIIAITFLCNYMRQCCDIEEKFKKISYLLIGLVLLIMTVEESSTGTVYVSTQRIALLLLMVYTVANLTSNGTNKKQLLSTTNNTSKTFTDTSRVISKLAVSWMTLAFLIGRRHNFILYISNMMLEASLNHLTEMLRISSVTKVLIYSTLSQFAFYSQGNTNLFTSIDVRPAFFGQTEFSLSLAVVLVAISTYSTQVFWYLRLFQRLNNDQTVKEVAILLNARNFLSLSYYMFVCMILSSHIFIWSVISPKLIYHFVTNNILLLTIVLISNLHRLKDLNFRLALTKESIN